MSSENQPPAQAKSEPATALTPELAPPPPSGPARETPVRRAWTRAARVQSLRRYLVAALAVVALAGSAVVWFDRAPAPVPGPAPETPPPDNAAAPALTPPPPDALRLPQAGGADALILAPQPGLALDTPTIAMSPPPPAAPGGSPANPTLDLPTVTVAPYAFHPVPDESQTRSIGPITLSDRLGNPVRVRPNASPPPSYVPSIGPSGQSPRALSNAAKPAPAKVTALPPLPPQRSAGPVAPLVANPPVFSGRARALGGVGIEVAGLKVRLFGVRPPEVQDRCADAQGKPLSCDAAVLAAMQQRLAGHSIVACRVPSGQIGDPGAICLDEEGTDLGRYLVIQGYALADVGQSYDYLPAEGAARTAKRGLWRYR